MSITAAAWFQIPIPDAAEEAVDSALRWRTVIDWPAIINTGFRLLVIAGLAWVAFRVLRLVLKRIERSIDDTDPTVSFHEQRIHTLVGLVRSVGVVFILVIALFMALGAVGLEIGPLLAGAGVVGLAISFGAQSLVRDILSGLFILIENQFGVGDVIRIKDVSGVVEKMTLRIVVLRDAEGIVHTVPNGEITQVSNMTRSYSRAVLDIGVAYKEDMDRVMAVMRDVCREFWSDAAWKPLLVEEPEVPGIEALAASSVNVRLVATTVPTKQWAVARELRLRIKRRFDAEGIEMPFPHQTLYWGDGQSPAGEQGQDETGEG